jgi:hypothetical protein
MATGHRLDAPAASRSKYTCAGCRLLRTRPCRYHEFLAARGLCYRDKLHDWMTLERVGGNAYVPSTRGGVDQLRQAALCGFEISLNHAVLDLSRAATIPVCS